MSQEMPSAEAKFILVIAAGVFVLGAVKWAIYPTAVRAPSMMARVVDGTTGQPIPGARVTIRTDLAEGLLAMCSPKRREIYRYTTITDVDGYFVVPAWGPKPIHLGSFGVPDVSSPQVEFEKNGYQCGSGWQSFSGGTDARPAMMSYLSGTAVLSSSWDHRKLLLYKDGVFPRGPHSDIIPLDKPVGYVVFAGE